MIQYYLVLVASAAWIARDLLGAHWTEEDMLPVFKRVLEKAKYGWGRGAGGFFGKAPGQAKRKRAAGKMIL